jgi:hypothetical protein
MMNLNFNRKGREARRDNLLETQLTLFAFSAISAVIHKELIDRMESI